MTIRREKLTRDLILEMNPLLDSNYKETGHLYEKLDINWDAYMSVGDAFVAIILRDGSGKIKGLMLLLVSPYSYISSLIVGQQLTFYIEKDRRFFANHMLNYSEELMDKMGVDFIIQSSKYESKFSDMLIKKGYQPSDLQFIKRLR